MKRIDLISSKEYWSTTIAIKMWNANKNKNPYFRFYEKLAEKIVDDEFMMIIEELKNKAQ